MRDRWSRPTDRISVPHQAIVELVSAVSRPIEGGSPLLEPAEARWEAEELLAQLDVVYPNETVLRTALRGAGAYQLQWFDVHLWAFAEVYGMTELLSEDFEHDRLYGSVRVVDPFRASQ